MLRNLDLSFVFLLSITYLVIFIKKEKMYLLKRRFLLTFTGFLFLVAFLKCTSYQNDYLLAFKDTLKNESGYINKDGDTVILAGKYLFCFTDTFRTFAIVNKKKFGFVAINRNEEVLYQIFTYDNGPDYAADGLFRIIKNNKIGYADPLTGEIKIEPKFSCAFPFEAGRAKVSTNCEIKTIGEHRIWLSNNWFYINKQGLKLKL